MAYKIYTDVNVHKQILKLKLKSGESISVKANEVIVNTWLNCVLKAQEIRSNKNFKVSVIENKGKYSLKFKEIAEIELWYDNNKNKINWNKHIINSPCIIKELHLPFMFDFIQLFNLDVSNKFWKNNNEIDMGNAIHYFCSDIGDPDMEKYKFTDGSPIFPKTTSTSFQIKKTPIYGYKDIYASTTKEVPFRGGDIGNYDYFHMVTTKERESWKPYSQSFNRIYGNTNFQISCFSIINGQKTKEIAKQTLTLENKNPQIIIDPKLPSAQYFVTCDTDNEVENILFSNAYNVNSYTMPSLCLDLFSVVDFSVTDSGGFWSALKVNNNSSVEIKAQEGSHDIHTIKAGGSDSWSIWTGDHSAVSLSVWWEVEGKVVVKAKTYHIWGNRGYTEIPFPAEIKWSTRYINNSTYECRAEISNLIIQDNPLKYSFSNGLAGTITDNKNAFHTSASPFKPTIVTFKENYSKTNNSIYFNVKWGNNEKTIWLPIKMD